jgi:hypothetical protein
VPSHLKSFFILSFCSARHLVKGEGTGKMAKM